jgi:hypothetical protein
MLIRNILLAALFLASPLAFSQSYSTTNDISYLKAHLDTNRQVYYSGDSLDIRITFEKNISILEEQKADIFLALILPNGNQRFIPLKNYVTNSSRRVGYIEQIDTNDLPDGVYQLGVIATIPGGSPNILGDWYNGLPALMDRKAVIVTSARVNEDNNEDGFLDGDYDGDGFLGDDEDLELAYFHEKHTKYKSSEYRQWEDDDWDDDDDDDWVDADNRIDWDDDDDYLDDHHQRHNDLDDHDSDKDSDDD